MTPDDDAIMTSNLAEFLRVALSSGPISVRDLQTKARAAGLLEQDKPISQSKPLRSVADTLGVKRLQRMRRWWWALPAKRNRHAGASDDAGKNMAPTTETTETTATSPSLEPPPSPSPDYSQMTQKEFVQASIKNARALASEVSAEAKINVEKYLQTGDLGDLFPDPSAQQGPVADLPALPVTTPGD